MEYRPTRKEIAYIADLDDKKLENWLTRGVVTLAEKDKSSRWRRFSIAEGIKFAFIHELTKYGVVAEYANSFVRMVLECSDIDGDTGEFNYMQSLRTQLEQSKRTVNPDGSVVRTGEFKPLAEMSDDEASRFLAALSKYRWALKCEITQSGPDLREAYWQIFLTEDESLPEDWQSCIVIKFKPIIDGVNNRWKEVMSKRSKENL